MVKTIGKPIISEEEAKRMSKKEREKFEIVKAKKPSEVIPRGEIPQREGKVEEVKPEIEKKPQPGIYVEARTGRPSGITLPDGRTFFGLSPEEIRDIQIKEGRFGKPLDLPLISEKTELEERKERALGLIQREAEMPREAVPEIQEEQRKQNWINTLLFGPVLPEGTQLAAGTLPLGPSGLAAGAAGAGGTRIGLKALGAGYFTKAISLFKGKLGVGTAAIGGGFAGAIIKDILEGGATERQGAINTYGQLATDVMDNVRMGIQTPQQAERDLRTLEEDLNRLQTEIKGGIISQQYLKLTGQMNDINADILDAQQQIINARNEILEIQIMEPDIIELAFYIEEIRKKYGIKKTTLGERLEAIKNE